MPSGHSRSSGQLSENHWLTELNVSTEQPEPLLRRLKKRACDVHLLEMVASLISKNEESKRASVVRFEYCIFTLIQNCTAYAMYIYTFLETDCLLVSSIDLVHFYTVLKPDEIYAAIETRRKLLGLSQAQVGQLAFDRDDTSPIQNIKRGSSPSVEKLAAIGEALGFELYFGPKRGGSNGPSFGIEGFAEAAVENILPAIDGSKEALREGFLPIPYDTGDPSNRGVAPLAFSRAWLNDAGLSPENLSFLSVGDEKMSPTLSKGSLALIEKGKRPRDLDVFSYIASGKISFARISAPDKNTMFLTYDHPLTAPLLLTEQNKSAIRLLGRVVWTGHNLCDG